MLSIIFDGTQLAQGAYAIGSEGPDWGSEAVAGALLTGQLRPDEIDQMAAEMNLTRVVVLPVKIKATSPDQMVTLQQTLTASLGRASKYAPLTMTVIPDGSTHVSTFKVWGGSWTSAYNQVAVISGQIFGTLTLQCFWPVYGAAQSFGSSGAPLSGGNQVSPAANTITPAPTGDIPADTTVFVKNRHATLPIRSLAAAVVSGNTTWVAGSPSSGWTVGANGNRVGSAITSTTSDTTTIAANSSFSSPALPTDRRFRVMLRCDEVLIPGNAPCSFRVRVITGQAEAVGEWRTPPDFNASVINPFLADMGAFMFPISEVGSLGAGSTVTTIFVEQRGNDQNTVVGRVYDALFLPEDSTVVAETSDTAKTLAAAGSTVQLESDQIYDSAGQAAAGVVTGAALRVLGASKIFVYTSQQYQGNMNVGSGYAPENVDVWVTLTPRYIHLA